MSFFAVRCPYCRQEVPWSARLNVIGDVGQMFIITAGVAAGMLLAWICFHIPKPNPETSMSLVVLLWYVQYVARQGKASFVRSLSQSTA